MYLICAGKADMSATEDAKNNTFIARVRPGAGWGHVLPTNLNVELNKSTGKYPQKMFIKETSTIIQQLLPMTELINKLTTKHLNNSLKVTLDTKLHVRS